MCKTRRDRNTAKLIKQKQGINRALVSSAFSQQSADETGMSDSRNGKHEQDWGRGRDIRARRRRGSSWHLSGFILSLHRGSNVFLVISSDEAVQPLSYLLGPRAMAQKLGSVRKKYKAPSRLRIIFFLIRESYSCDLANEFFFCLDKRCRNIIER